MRLKGSLIQKIAVTLGARIFRWSFMDRGGQMLVKGERGIEFEVARLAKVLYGGMDRGIQMQIEFLSYCV